MSALAPRAPIEADIGASPKRASPILWVGRSSRAGIQIGVVSISGGGEACSAELAAALNNELIVALSGFRWLGRVRCFDDDSAPDVDYFVTGAIRPNDARLRVSLNVVDRRAGDIVVWSGRYDIGRGDLTGAASQIAGTAAAQIDCRLWLWPTTRARHPEVSACTSWELVELAAPMVLRFNRREFMTAGRWLERAVEIDPGNVEAYAWLVHWYIHLLSQDWATDRAAAVERGLEMARTTVKLEPQHARGLTLAGHMFAFHGNHAEEGLPLHDQALALNPNLDLIWRFSAHAYSYLGDGAEAVRRINHAQTLCPAGPQGAAVLGGLATAYWVQGDFAKAAEAGRAAIALDPRRTTSYKGYVTAMGHLGLNEQARNALATLLRLEPGFTMEQAMRRSPFVTRAARSLYAEGLRAAGLR
jgi:tetratricopeptide (TPR) repeat protein